MNYFQGTILCTASGFADLLCATFLGVFRLPGVVLMLYCLLCWKSLCWMALSYFPAIARKGFIHDRTRRVGLARMSLGPTVFLENVVVIIVFTFGADACFNNFVKWIEKFSALYLIVENFIARPPKNHDIELWHIPVKSNHRSKCHLRCPGRMPLLVNAKTICWRNYLVMLACSLHSTG